MGKVWAGVGQKNTPQVGGVMATLPLRRCEVTAFCGWRRGVFRRFEGVFVWRSGWRLGVFAYLCGMATSQVGSVAAKAVGCSVPVSGRSKTKAQQKPKTPVGHE